MNGKARQETDTEGNIQWTRNTGDSKHCTHQTRIHRSFLQRDTLTNDQDRAREQARRTETSNGTATDETDRVGRDSTDEGAKLEYGEGD